MYEFIKCISGCILLWLPIGFLVYYFLKDEISEFIPRLTLSLVASYTFTTFFYHFLSIVNCARPVFIIVLLAVSYFFIRRSFWQGFRLCFSLKKINFLLLLLIGLCIWTNIHYKRPWKVDENTGEYTYQLHKDHFYHVGQAYELSKHIPPKQCIIRAGTLERAYHNYYHITTALLGKFTGQKDLLRVHFLYHYTIIEILLCLLLYSLLFTITSNRIAGYLAIIIMYPAALFMPELWDSNTHLFYFTYWPHRSSGLEPVALASPQMYSGLIILYGILLCYLCLSDRRYQNVINSNFVLWILALLTAAAFKFRVHIFIVAFPIFLLLSAYWYHQYREKYYLYAAGVTILIVIITLMEMNSSAYVPQTSNIKIGNNGLCANLDFFINSWPYAQIVYEKLITIIPNPLVFGWVWQIFSMSTFVLLNVIGIPLAIFTCYQACHCFYGKCNYSLFFWVSSFMATSSLVGGMVLSTDYDNYSVGGQLLLHTRWYLFPLLSLTLWQLYRISVFKLKIHGNITKIAAVILLCLVLFHKMSEPLGKYRQEHVKQIKFSSEEWQMLQFLKNDLPEDAVYISRNRKYMNNFILSGLTGRAIYLELPSNPVDRHANSITGNRCREKTIELIWSTVDIMAFDELIRSTPCTHIIESAKNPLKIHPLSIVCLVWQSNFNNIRIWEIVEKKH